MTPRPELTPAERWRRRYWVLVAILVSVPLMIGVYVAIRFLPDRPVRYADIREHFKYGSTGGERTSGLPYYVWQVMPKVCEKLLPKNGRPGYEAFGMVYEPGHDLPVGVMKRRNLGIDRVFVNCAVCHHSTVRDTKTGPSHLYIGMPSARVDLGAFETFLFDCVASENFRSDIVVPFIEKEAGGLSPLDRYVVYPAALALMRERIMMLRERFQPLHPLSWGPGRVDTFNSAKALFNFDFHKLPDRELWGAADFPSIWSQAERRRNHIHAHWDGNNSEVEERNKSAAFGTGTTPATIDLVAIKRIEDWLETAAAPEYPYPIDHAKAVTGEKIYVDHCFGCHGWSGPNFSAVKNGTAPSGSLARTECKTCHGASGPDFSGGAVGEVVAIGAIGTDPDRLQSYTYDLSTNQSGIYAGEPYRFSHFRKTFGYANSPLDGIWLRAPYLHNGSVPTLRDLLKPSDQRPKQFYRGYDVFDQQNVGFVSSVEPGIVPRNAGTLFDTSLQANLRRGHEGSIGILYDRLQYGGEEERRVYDKLLPYRKTLSYGTELSDQEKDALVEYMKSF
jgi:hypothetical protein